MQEIERRSSRAFETNDSDDSLTRKRERERECLREGGEGGVWKRVHEGGGRRGGGVGGGGSLASGSFFRSYRESNLGDRVEEKWWRSMRR